MAWILLTLLLYLNPCTGYKILAVFPYPGKSISSLGDAVVRDLLEAGHKVTYITPFPKKDPPSNLNQIDISQIETKNLYNITEVIAKKVDLNNPRDIFDYLVVFVEKVIQNENVQKLLKSPESKFDVAVIQWLYSELYSGFSVAFDCPYIWHSTLEPHSAILSLIDEPLNPAYNADILSTNLPPFTFMQRLQELWYEIKGIYWRNFYFINVETTKYEALFGPIVAEKGRSLPPYEEVKYNASLVLGNSYLTMGESLTLPQSYKSIGGYHVDKHLKPLPQKIKAVMDNAKNGTIFFSMGSNLKSSDLPEQMKKDLLKMFSELKQEVVWKFEDELTERPRNVHVIKWAPQQSILAHPHCHLFITHGGLLSTIEAIHYGVPIIGIPVYGDQYINVNRAVKKGIGQKVDISPTIADDLKVAIEDILSNPKYKERMKELSLVYHDRPVPPSQELVHWVEHVARTRGAPHLRSPATVLPWFQKLYLDLLALLFGIIVILMYIIKRIVLFKISLREKIKNE